MLENGLLEETKRLVERGLLTGTPRRPSATKSCSAI